MALVSTQTDLKARGYHAAFSSDHNMVVWAGRGCQSDVLDTFNVFSLEWRLTKRLEANDAPEYLHSMAVARDGNDRLYSFGGGDVRSNRLINSLYCLDMNSLACREIVPATGTHSPSPRSNSAMIYCNRRLVTYGGYTNDGTSSDLFLLQLDNSEDCKVVCHVFVSCRPGMRAGVSVCT